MKLELKQRFDRLAFGRNLLGELEITVLRLRLCYQSCQSSCPSGKFWVGMLTGGVDRDPPLPRLASCSVANRCPCNALDREKLA